MFIVSHRVCYDKENAIGNKEEIPTKTRKE